VYILLCMYYNLFIVVLDREPQGSRELLTSSRYLNVSTTATTTTSSSAARTTQTLPATISSIYISLYSRP